MLLFPSVLLASLSTTPLAPAAHARPYTAPLRAAQAFARRAAWRELRLSLPCIASGSRCVSLLSGRSPVEAAPAAAPQAARELEPPRRSDAFRTQGGFVHLDVVASPELRVGPELSWSTPDSPREDLPKMRLLSPGWGVRFALSRSPLALGVSACSRFVMVGSDLPVVDLLTSEARFEVRLP